MTIAIFGETGLIGSAIRHEFKEEFMTLKLNKWVDTVGKNNDQYLQQTTSNLKSTLSK
jgi:hypothetical protein